ncbi:MAG: FAD-dependent oxidoreductase [Chloroflexi bacterium]|nr:FAD-dependent oxidoreductase [Chloroflexota bacterium]
MSVEFKHLFTPIQVGHKLVANRIAVSGHVTGMNPQGYPTDRFIAYHEQKAKNGVGLLITMGSSSVHPTSDNLDWGGVLNWDDSIIPHFQKMAAAIKQHPTVLLAQISHRGRRGRSTGNFRPLYAPSPIPEPVHNEMPHEIGKEDIAWLVEAYAQAALRLKKGNFDGVELSAAHGHLIDEFWSPISNVRTDEYGGSLENRLRFGFQVIERVREVCGHDFIVGIRITGDEMIEGGLDPEVMCEIAQRLAAHGELDFINVMGSVAATSMTQAMCIPTMYMPLGPYVPFAAAVREAVLRVREIPIIVAGRIVDPVQADQILTDGAADLVVMNRAIIADPELPKKAREGRLDDIRLCMGVNYCSGRLSHGGISCIQNPVIGREAELAEIHPAPVRKKVVVAGGGPAGLEAARVASLRGHDVVLYDQSDRLGGQILIAARAPQRASVESSVQWLERQVRNLGVTVYTGKRATPEMVLAERPDAVVVATGSTARRPDLPGVCGPNVVSARDVLLGQPVGDRVLLYDDLGTMEGVSTADYLAEQGKRVVLVTKHLYAGHEVDGSTRAHVFRRLYAEGVTFKPDTVLREVRSDAAVLENYYTRSAETVTNVDTIVIAAGGRAVDDLYRALLGKVPELSLIGDAMASRGLADAILEGTRIGRAI